MERLAKLAAVSAKLRKQAGLLGAAANFAMKHPVGTGAAALSTAGGITGAKNAYKKSKNGFKPENIEQRLNGQPPIPPAP